MIRSSNLLFQLGRITQVPYIHTQQPLGRLYSSHFDNPIEQKITQILSGEIPPSSSSSSSSSPPPSFSPLVLDIKNESYMHNVPRGSETHFKVTIVDDIFEGKNRVRRHQLVYGALKEVLEGGVHALSVIAKTHQEYEKEDFSHLKSPNCMGAKKK